MGFSHHHQEDYNQFNQAHQASLTHELLGGAVAYEATRAYEKHCEANGQPVTHAGAKAALAALGGGLLDRLVETKGLDAWDQHKRDQALKHAEQQFDRYQN